MAKLGSREIEVRASAGSGGGVGFALFENGNPIADDTIVCAKQRGQSKKRDFHDFVFTLVNGSGVDLRFAEAPNEAMWVKKKRFLLPLTCPTERKNHPHIDAIGVSPDRLQLTVRNHNPVKSKYRFALNFETSGTNPQAVSFDPIWANQNGGDED